MNNSRGIRYLTKRGLKSGHPFADNIFKCILSKENFDILIEISLKLVAKIQIDKSAMVGFGLGTKQATSH